MTEKLPSKSKEAGNNKVLAHFHSSKSTKVLYLYPEVKKKLLSSSGCV